MKSLVLYRGKAEIEIVPDPVPHGEWVVVKVESSPLCGSDKKAFLSDTPVRVAGHEGTGVVEAVAGSSLLKVGDRVVLNPLSGCGHCWYCKTGNYIYCPQKPQWTSHFAEYTLLQDFVCTKLPDDIDFDLGSLACCALGPGMGSIRRMNVQAFDKVLITGMGPVGLGALALAKFQGAYVIAVESAPYRVKLAREMGADVVLDPMDPEILDQIRTVDPRTPLFKAIECSGNSKAERLCIDALEPLGLLSCCGENHQEISIRISEDFIRKGLTLMGNWHCSTNDAQNMYTILRRSPVVGKIITHRFSFSLAQEAFEQFMTSNTGKVLINPWK